MVWLIIWMVSWKLERPKYNKKRRRTTYKINEVDDSNMHICTGMVVFVSSLDFHVINACSLVDCFRIKRILRFLHKTTAPRWYGMCEIHLLHTHAQCPSVHAHLSRFAPSPHWQALFYEFRFPFFIHNSHIGFIGASMPRESSIFCRFGFSSFVYAYLKLCQWNGVPMAFY